MNKVSVIVPCYNQDQYLDEALHSVIEQIYTNWECIIINDGSSDDTEFVAKRWLKKDYRFSYLKIKNGGLSNARNIGIQKAQGEYILPLDADDKIEKKYIKLALEEFNKHKDLKLVYCNAVKFGEVNGIWNLKPYSLLNLARENMIFCSAIYRKKDWSLVNGYDINMKYGWEDWEFWIAILKNGGKVKKIDYTGFFYRIKKDSMVLNMKEYQKKELLKYISIKHVDFYVEEFGSFHSLYENVYSLNKKFSNIKNNNKKILNLFFKKNFGFEVFKI